MPREHIILPPLYIKLGLLKQYVKALNKEGECFQYISRSFPKLSAVKLKARIFYGPQIRKYLNDVNDTESMTTAEKKCLE